MICGYRTFLSSAARAGDERTRMNERTARALFDGMHILAVRSAAAAPMPSAAAASSATLPATLLLLAMSVPLLLRALALLMLPAARRRGILVTVSIAVGAQAHCDIVLVLADLSSLQLLQQLPLRVHVIIVRALLLLLT